MGTMKYTKPEFAQPPQTKIMDYTLGTLVLAPARSRRPRGPTQSRTVARTAHPVATQVRGPNPPPTSPHLPLNRYRLVSSRQRDFQHLVIIGVGEHLVPDAERLNPGIAFLEIGLAWTLDPSPVKALAAPQKKSPRRRKVAANCQIPVVCAFSFLEIIL